VSDVLGGRQVQRHPPIREQVAEILRDAIVDMQLEPGRVLVERELCEMTQASRPSVREALRQLEAEGLVESINGKGTVVAETSPELARHVYQIRAELEGLAAELFAIRADDALRAQFARAVDELAASARDGEPRAVLGAKNRAYEVLFQGAGNPILTQQVHLLQRRVSQLRALTLAQPGRPAESLEEIRAIQRAVEAGDPAAARAAATYHVQQAARTGLAALGDSGAALAG
jgi:DNA-binding GntR family transcriptional regulator